MTPYIVRCLAPMVAAMMALPGVAMAQEVPAPPAPATTAETPPPPPGPSLWLVAGITSLGFSYAPAAMVAATSGLAIDRSLLVPLVGPWIDLSQRAGCAPGAPCSDRADKDLLVMDGAFQAASLVAALFGLVSAPRASATTAPVADVRPTLRLAPAQVGATGHGLLAAGTF